MLIKDFLNRAGNVARSLAHYGRLGKTASRRGFLLRERKKLLMKLGEKAVVLAKENKLDSPELLNLVRHIEKFEFLLSELDYGGKDGTDFSQSKRGGKSTKRRGRRAKNKY